VGTDGIVDENLKADLMVLEPYSVRNFDILLINPAGITGEQDQKAACSNK